MDNNKYFFAVDLGATSGRTIIGTLAEGKVQLEELTRFDNSLIETGGHFYWDIFALYNEIIKGLKLVAKRQLPITSIGIDTWGVDFVCIGEDNAILRNPIAYRDPFTFEAMDEYFSKCVDKKRVYETTGIQFMNFNSLFQLYAMRRENNVALANAKKILFVPDALSWMLTEKTVCEYTIASTSQMLNPRTKDLEPELLKSVGLTREKFGMMVNPGTCIGTLTKEVQKMTGLGAIPVIAVAGHDTGSAVAAVPAKNEQFAYLSSGTWSLMGIETKDAIINEVSYETGQHVPEGYAETCRCIFESLALRYREVFGYLREMAAFPINTLHIIGGGSLNRQLNQFTANATGVEVLAGPQECTALGNIMIQAKAAGEVNDIFDMRSIIADSVVMNRFVPEDKELWDEAYGKYLEIKKRKG